MGDEDFSDENDLTSIEKFSSTLTYNFDYNPYDRNTFDKRKNEPDSVLAEELKRYYPELVFWPKQALATAWRSYSQDVGLVEEELVCFRSPNLLAYLFVRQEKWPVTEGGWLIAIDAAIRILWPSTV